MALDVLYRLTLTTIFRPLSDDGFLTSFLPFRRTFGIFNLFDKDFKSYDHRGIRSPNLLVRSQTLYPLGNAACWGLSRFCFFLQWVTQVRSKTEHSSCYRLSVSIFFFARNWYLLSSSLVCLVESGQTDVAGSFSFANHDWDLRPRNWNLRRQRDLNLRSSDSEADTLSVGLWGLFQFCFVTVNELTEV